MPISLRFTPSRATLIASAYLLGGHVRVTAAIFGGFRSVVVGFFPELLLFPLASCAVPLPALIGGCSSAGGSPFLLFPPSTVFRPSTVVARAPDVGSRGSVAFSLLPTAALHLPVNNSLFGTVVAVCPPLFSSVYAGSLPMGWGGSVFLFLSLFNVALFGRLSAPPAFLLLVS